MFEIEIYTHRDKRIQEQKGRERHLEGFILRLKGVVLLWLLQLRPVLQVLSEKNQTNIS